MSLKNSYKEPNFKQGIYKIIEKKIFRRGENFSQEIYKNLPKKMQEAFRENNPKIKF